MEAKREDTGARVIRLLFGISGLFFLLMAAGYNEYLFKFLAPGRHFTHLVISTIRSDQVCFLILGLAQIILSWSFGLSSIGKLMGRRGVINLLLFFLVFGDMAAVLEFTLRPFAFRDRSSIIMADEKLGWKLRPGMTDYYDGSLWTINGKGLIGPEVNYQKKGRSFRILYLGDSVIFGMYLPGYQDTYPYLLEPMLEDCTDVDVETINAGVCGYNTRQEYTYLLEEGLKYQPDLIILSFVQNDVSDWIPTDRSARLPVAGVVHADFHSNSGIFYLISLLQPHWVNKIKTKALPRFLIPDSALVTRAETPEVQRAWSVALTDVDKIARICHERQIPLLVVAFPLTFQFENIEKYNLPQKILGEFTRQKGIPFFDLLPPLADHLRQNNLSCRDYFLDECHPTRQGNYVAAQLVSQYLIDHGLVKPSTGN